MEYLFEIGASIKVKKTRPQILGTVIDRKESGEEDNPDYLVRYEDGRETWHSQDVLEAA